MRTENPARLGPTSSIAAIIPQYQCEDWLGQCIASLVAQTRPLQAIIVIDDGSPEPPVEIVRRFGKVTLLRSPENVGPYVLIQSVIEATSYDGYLFQDADDWSAPRRLELLLEECATSGAELVGCQGLRVYEGGRDSDTIRFPTAVRDRIMSGSVRYPVLHPSSLVSRSLVMRIGGFASGLRIAGDAEFQQRAVHAAHATNVPDVAYFRRIRQHSLTTSVATGRSSEFRRGIEQKIRAHLRKIRRAVRSGETPDLAPIVRRLPIVLDHVCGPPPDVGSAFIPDLSATAPQAGRAESSAGGPVFITGLPQSGAGNLLGALAYHPSLAAVPGAIWLTRRLKILTSLVENGRIDAMAASDLLSCVLREIVPPYVQYVDPRLKGTLEDLATVGSAEVVHAMFRTDARRWVDSSQRYDGHLEALLAVFPEAQVIHLVEEPTEDASAEKGAPRKLGMSSEMIYQVSPTRLAVEPDGCLGEIQDFLSVPRVSACSSALSLLTG